MHFEYEIGKTYLNSDRPTHSEKGLCVLSGTNKDPEVACGSELARSQASQGSQGLKYDLIVSVSTPLYLSPYFWGRCHYGLHDCSYRTLYEL